MSVPVERDRHESAAERAARALAQSTRIADAGASLRGTEPIVVHEADSLQHLAELAVERPECRVISVVDDGERLIGLVPIRTLVDDIFLKIVPEEFLGEITDLESALRYASDLGVRTAADVMVEPVWVRPEETVRDAFERMHHANLNGLPITDVEGRISGYLDQLELLLAWVQATGREALLRPADH
jgi:CBS domain-containing protein